MKDRNVNFFKLLKDGWSQGRYVCVGLDPDIKKIPPSARAKAQDGEGVDILKTILHNFLKPIVCATKEIALAYKLNSAFFEAYGIAGLKVLHRTIEYIHEKAPDVAVICDSKRADIGNTNTGYSSATFGFLKADAVTVNPYFGGDSLEPFFIQRDKGIVVLCRTSNDGAEEFQDIIDKETGLPLYQLVARNFATKWNSRGNCALVVGANQPEKLAEVREIVEDMPILVPAIGAQGGMLKESVLAGRNSKREGIIINVSRSAIYASSGEDFAIACRNYVFDLNEEIRDYILS